MYNISKKCAIFLKYCTLKKLHIFFYTPNNKSPKFSDKKIYKQNKTDCIFCVKVRVRDCIRSHSRSHGHSHIYRFEISNYS